MAPKHFYASITNCTGIKEINARDNVSNCAASVEVVCQSHTLSIGDVVTVDFGTVDNHGVFLTNGIVKSIQTRKPEYDYVITIYDKLVMAQDNFIAPDDPDAPLSYVSTAPETIVQALLTLSGVTGTYYGTATGFLSGLADNPLEIKLVTAWQVIENFNRICAYMTWVEPNGDIYFNPRKPYIEGGDTSSLSILSGNSGNLLRIDRKTSDELIRNKVVVYGKDGTGIRSSASASSPYLPVGFYKTMVLAHDIIDRQDMADATASYNLTMFNRLTEEVNVVIKGDYSLRCRSIVDVTDSFCGLSGDLFFVSSTQHNWSKTGYTVNATLVR